MQRTIGNEPIDASRLQGVYTALITPMLAGNGLSNEIDYPKLWQLLDDQVKAGVDGVVVAGTTGQSATLSPKEHVEFVSRVYEACLSYPLQFIVGAGSNCTREAIELSKAIEFEIGPSTFLHVTGYYNNPPQEGLIAHFSALASALPRSNIILYNVPGRTSSKIEPETAIHLAKYFDNIIGLKEASGASTVEAVRKISASTDPKKFRVLSGEDDLVAQVMKAGGYGVISASANVAPRYFVNLVQMALAGNYERAEALQNEINPLVKQGVFCKKNPIPLAHMFSTELRLPLTKLPQIDSQLEQVLSLYSPEVLGVDVSRYK